MVPQMPLAAATLISHNLSILSSDSSTFTFLKMAWRWRRWRRFGPRLSSDNEHRRNPAAATILRTSRLSKDQPNRILLYLGSFNPPHISHLQVLRHALESSPDLNIVAAIIIMMDEDHLRGKNQSSGRSLVLTSKKRATLWYEDSRFPACAWVCESWTILENLQRDLIREATKDDLEICFTSLCGPDCWPAFDPPMQINLVSDAGREAKWYVGKRPSQVAEQYTPWKRVNPSTIRTNGQAEQGGKSRSKLGTRYAKSDAVFHGVRHCGIQPH